MPGITVIFFALKYEVGPLLKNLNNKVLINRSRPHIIKGSRNGRDIYIILTGMGREHAVNSVKYWNRLSKSIKSSREFLVNIIIAGTAAALDEKLCAGDIIVCSKIFFRMAGNDKNSVLAADCRIINEYNIAIPGVKTIKSGLVTVSRLLHLPEEKKRLQNKKAAVADMESYWILKTIIESESSGHISITCVRAVTDTLIQPIPLFFDHFLSQDNKKDFIYVFLAIRLFFKEFKAILKVMASGRKAVRNLNLLLNKMLSSSSYCN